MPVDRGKQRADRLGLLFPDLLPDEIDAFLAVRGEKTASALRVAQRTVDLSAVPEQIRLGGQAMFRAGDLGVKVHTFPGALERSHGSARRAVDVSRALAAAGLCVPPAEDLPNPLYTEHGAVTFWPWVRSVRPANWTDVGMLLRRLHDFPLDKVPHGVGSHQHLLFDLPKERLDFLEAREQFAPEVRRVRRQLARHEPVVRAVFDRTQSKLVHYDGSPSNVIVVAAGSRLIDLDSISLAIPQVDMMKVVPFELPAEQAPDVPAVQEYSAAYGTDITSLPGFQSLLASRQLMLATFLMWRDYRSEPNLELVDSLVSAAEQTSVEAPYLDKGSRGPTLSL
jgi:hypothetical protein